MHARARRTARAEITVFFSLNMLQIFSSDGPNLVLLTVTASKWPQNVVSLRYYLFYIATKIGQVMRL